LRDNKQGAEAGRRNCIGKEETEQTELIEPNEGWGLNFFTMSNVSGVENTVGK
jgi:hypothetical protein